ncbi:MAG: hypothetical protein IJ776_02750 [Paludibacteraceae bacterium]|nr:hypothetical protein [Paludibacteraceae bacterium]
MDTHYRMTANAVLLYYQDCWARYMSCLHMAAFDMVHKNRMWVIVEFNAYWEEHDAFWSQDVEVKVWNSEVTGLRLYADFVITKPDGTPISHGNGCWTLLDIESHRPTAISETGVEKLRLCEGEKHVKNRIPAGQTMLCESEHRVNPINLDFNGHVNNRTYLNIALQTVLSDWADGRKLHSLTIRWLHETFLGDTLVCRLWQTDQPNTYLHVISKDDKAVAQIYSALTERTDQSIIDTEAPRL